MRGLNLARAQVATAKTLLTHPGEDPASPWCHPQTAACYRADHQIINTTALVTLPLLCSRSSSQHLTSRSSFVRPNNPTSYAQWLLPFHK